MNIKNLVRIRLAEIDDHAFIIDNWTKATRFSPMFRMISNAIYSDAYRQLIADTIEDSVLKVACSSDDQSILYGFSCYRKDIFHYVFVKRHFRGFGIFKMLWDDYASLGYKNITYTHLPKDKRLPVDLKFIFNPFIFLRGKHESKIS